MSTENKEHLSGQRERERPEAQTAPGPQDTTPYLSPLVPPREQEGKEITGATVAIGEDVLAQDEERSRNLKGGSAELAPPVPGYKAVRKLGAGTYGAVWRYEEEGTGIQVAIKFFPVQWGRQLLSLQNEVKQLALLDAAPGIVQLKDVCPDGEPPYLIMAYAEKGSVEDRLQAGPLPLPEALSLFRQIAEALAYVHAKGIRHCDLKPGNVLLDTRDKPLLADFGQARLSRDPSLALGTFFYMAPEQAQQSLQVPDTRWDVYGLGALFYVMLTGKVPREDGTLRVKLGQTSDSAHRLDLYREGLGTAPRPTTHRQVQGVDRPLAEIVDRCLELDPEKRLRDAGAVLAALERRERQRRQRPLLVFGLLLPLLLVLTLLLPAYLLLEQTIQRYRSDLIAQLQHSNHVGAISVARAVEQELLNRMDLLRECAEDNELQSLLKKYAGADNVNTALETRAGERGTLVRRLRAFRHRYQETLDPLGAGNENTPRDPRIVFPLDGWVIVDRHGYFLATARDEGEPGIVKYGTNFSYREWFNGKEDKKGEENKRHRYVGRPYVSRPFWSRLKRDKKIVALTYPIRAVSGPEQGRLLGVLLASVPLRDISGRLKTLYMDAAGREASHLVVVLVNHRGQCIAHREDESEIITPHGKEPPSFDFGSLRDPWEKDNHTDPVDGKDYLAAYAPLGPGIGGGVLVQLERAPALEPVGALKEKVYRYGLMTLVAVSLLTSGLWGWLLWKLRREERLAHV